METRHIRIDYESGLSLKKQLLSSEMNFDTLRIAEKELLADVLPITIKRPLPKKSEKEIKILTDEEIKEKLEEKKEKEKKEVEKLEEKKEQIEEKDEKEIEQEGEIMEMANPVDEVDEVEDKPEEV